MQTTLKLTDPDYETIRQSLNRIEQAVTDFESWHKAERLASLFRSQGMTAKAVKRDGKWTTESDGTC